ncbi:MAG: gliding motility-associated C-terminal domain-containing protein, partial [Flavobacteriales bacterium]
LVFGGAYDVALIFPAATPYQFGVEQGYSVSPWNGPDCSFVNWNAEYPFVYCGDSLYGQFAYDFHTELRDGFISRGFDTRRAPYDIWRRENGATCDRSALDPCVHLPHSWECPDTLILCAGQTWTITMVEMLTSPFSFYTSQVDVDINCAPGQNGFEVDFLWSDGSTASEMNVFTEGWVWCTITTHNGCWSWTDSAYVLIEAPPSCPQISDGLGINISTCLVDSLHCTDSLWLWCTNVPLGYDIYWYSDSVVVNDSLFSTGGSYEVYVVSPNGCVSMTSVDHSIDPQEGAPPNVSDVQFTFMYNGSMMGDTAIVCDGECVSGELALGWFIDGQSAPPPQAQMLFSGSGCGGGGSYSGLATDTLGWSVPTYTSGWYDIGAVVQLTVVCVDTVLPQFYGSDSIYVLVVPGPTVLLTSAGLVCPGDSVPVLIGCTTCDSLVHWNGTEYGNGIAVTVYATQPGIYSAAGFDTSLALTCPGGAWVEVLGPEVDLPLVIYPPLICPGDTALLWTTLQGTNYEWIGPNGPIAVDNDTVPITDFGDYFLTVVDTSGCVLTNGPIELNAFSSPYLDVQPDYVLCPGDSGTITVVTDDVDSIVWGAPLSGNATSQTITQAGLYTCTIGGCSPQTLTAYIIGGSPNATILPDDSLTLCPGDSVLLSGAAGEAVYLWDAFQFQQSLWVDEAGIYQLVVFDEVGCMDTALAVVELVVPGDPLIAVGDTVCQGMDAQLTATGSGQLVWYGDAGLTDTLAIGGVLAISDAQQSGTFYVVQQDGPCASATVVVELVVLGDASNAYVSGPSLICVGDSLLLDMVGGPFTTVLWNTPSGNYSADPLVIAPVSLLDEGTYFASPIAPPCNWPTYVWVVEVVEPELLSIGPDTALCAGSPLTLALPTGFNNGQWSNGAAGPSATFTVPAVCIVSATDGSGCVVQDTLIAGDLSCIIEVPNTFSPNSDGVNDGWQVNADGFADVHAIIYNRWGQELYSDDPTIHPWRGRNGSTNEEVPDGVYFYALTLTRYNGSEEVRTGYIQLTR